MAFEFIKNSSLSLEVDGSGRNRLVIRGVKSEKVFDRENPSKMLEHTVVQVDEVRDVLSPARGVVRITDFPPLGPNITSHNN